jgi:hypothetical protein
MLSAFWSDVEAAQKGEWVAPLANPRKKRKVDGPVIEIQDDDEIDGDAGGAASSPP